MPNTIEFLLSPEVRSDRRKRLGRYHYYCGTPNRTHVVHVETAKGFVELDAEDEAHAIRLIDTWIGQLGHISAKYYRSNDRGELVDGSRIYDFRDYRVEEYCED